MFDDLTTGTYDCFVVGMLPVDEDELVAEFAIEALHLPYLRMEPAVSRWCYDTSTVDTARVNEIVSCLEEVAKVESDGTR